MNELVLIENGKAHASSLMVAEKFGKEHKTVTSTRVDKMGELTPQEYDQTVRDLVNFLEYSGDPVKLERHALGWWVMAFLVFFTIIVVLLKKEYWRDVH